MSTRALGSAVVVSAFLLGCAAIDREGGGHDRERFAKARFLDQDCHSASCQIDVNVDCPLGVCTAVVDPKVLLIIGGNDNQIVMWTLKGEHGFAFPDDGIKFTSDFTCEKLSAQKFKCTDRHYTKNAVLEYQVKVTNVANPGSPVTIDPWIVNN